MKLPTNLTAKLVKYAKDQRVLEALALASAALKLAKSFKKAKVKPPLE